MERRQEEKYNTYLLWGRSQLYMLELEMMSCAANVNSGFSHETACITEAQMLYIYLL